MKIIINKENTLVTMGEHCVVFSPQEKIEIVNCINDQEQIPVWIYEGEKELLNKFCSHLLKQKISSEAKVLLERIEESTHN